MSSKPAITLFPMVRATDPLTSQ